MKTAFTLALAALAAAGFRQQAKPAPADGIVWIGDWEEASREAKARNVPIHVTFHKDN